MLTLEIGIEEGRPLSWRLFLFERRTMAIKTISKCPICGFPINAEYEGQTTVCAYCGTKLEAVSQGVTIPTWLFASGIGLAIGIIFGPVILGSTESGARYLERRAREKLSR